MSKKITQEEFEKRFYRNYPKANITVLEYTAISNPAKIKCNICGKELNRKIARQFINGFNCCNAHTETKAQKAKRFYEGREDFEIIKQLDKDSLIIKHNVCGNEYKRALVSILDNPYACKYCETHKTNNMLSIDEVQKVIDERFNGTIKILDYNGQLEKNHYRCLKCGKIFTQQQTCLMQSNGCPQCDRFKSMGEQRIKKLLEKNNISFEEQYYIPELIFQHFDFAVFKENTSELDYLIEVQGDQHYKETGFFSPLKVQQERDERKRKYCKNHNIPLYEIRYHKGKFLNLDILPFLSSTTISVNESTT